MVLSASWVSLCHLVQPGTSAAWPGHPLACGSQAQRKQVGLGRRGAGLDWTGYNLLACRTDVSSGRTEAGMRRLKPCQSRPVKVAAALHISFQPGIRAGLIAIAPPRPCAAAPQLLKPLPRLAVAALLFTE